MKQFLFTICFLSILFDVNAQTWDEVKKSVASDRAFLDEFGTSVSISGKYALVGAYNENDDVSGNNTLTQAGSAYFFERGPGGNWGEVQKVVASDRGSYDSFGASVSISGNYAIIAAPFNDEDTAGGNTLEDAGAAYIFERDVNGNWMEVQKIVAADRIWTGNFSRMVDLEGDYAIIGGERVSAYVFERLSNGNWVEKAKLTASDSDNDDYFGFSVSISGSFAFVGALLDDEDTSGGNPLHDAGSVYVFERDIAGNWNEIQKLTSTDRDINDQFGYDLSLDGNYAVVSAYNESEDTLGTNTLEKAGSVYVFERESSGTWVETQKLVASDRDMEDYFGASVSISGDFTLIGARLEDENSTGGNFRDASGSAYLFQRDTLGKWVEMEKIVAWDRRKDAYFGTEVCINGNKAVIGAPGELMDASGGNPKGRAGAAYFFESCGIITSSISPSTCDTYTSPSGIFNWDSTGTYIDTLESSNGCDSIITVNLTVVDVDTSVVEGGVGLIAIAQNATFQWLDCDMGYAIVPGATDSIFMPDYNVYFAVEVTQNGCVDTSSCYVILESGIIKNDISTELKYYPNPTSKSVNIEFERPYREVEITLLNAIGQFVGSQVYQSVGNLQFDIETSPGLYIMEIKTSEGTSALIKVILQ